MTSIMLDKERGVNPGVLGCERCGEDYGVALYGRGGYKKKCSHCDTVNICMAGTQECGNCGKYLSGKPERLRPTEKVHSGLCTKCEEAQKATDDAVKEGGVYWKCKDCGSAGAVRHSTTRPCRGRVQQRRVVPSLQLRGQRWTCTTA